jgi:plasmid stabilization system protein ParE
MAATTQKQRISLDAALLAVQWKSDFAEALHHLAQEFAGDSATINAVHYQQALPAAVETLLANPRGSERGLGPFSKERRKVI